MPLPPKPASPAEPDPSMDEILASIRRILSDEEKLAKDNKPGDDVLMLDPSMMVEDRAHPAPPAPMPEPPMPPPVAEPTPAPLPLSTMPDPDPEPMPPPPAPSPDTLIAPEAAAAAAGAVGSLMRTLVAERNAAIHRGGPTIEDLVREEIRPLLKAWLDAHLPATVERLVRAEIERVMGRVGS